VWARSNGPDETGLNADIVAHHTSEAHPSRAAALPRYLTLSKI